MPEYSLHKHVTITYKAIRFGLAYIAFGFPLLLVFGGYILAQVHLEDSMSAYYHASFLSQVHELYNPGNHAYPGGGVMRNWFVGLLFAEGFILFLYKGFTRMEDYALNIAGLMCFGMALFPIAWGDEFPGITFTILGVHCSLHGICAVVFFLCLGYVCIFRAADTLELVLDKSRRKQYCLSYKLLGGAMIVSPLTAFVLSGVFHKQDAFTFLVELIGIWMFAAYWIIKSHEISETNADRRAASGEFEVLANEKRNPFRAARVSLREVDLLPGNRSRTMLWFSD